MNGLEREISYKFVRKVSYWVEDGFWTEDISTGEETGFFFDVELAKLKAGKQIVRGVEEVGEEHDFYTRKFRPPTEAVYQRIFRYESTGKIKDVSMNNVPFDQGQNVKISLRLIEKDVIEIWLRAV